MKKGLIVRHVPYEGIAGFREPIEAAGYELDRFDVTDPGFWQLDLTTPDLVILMGGPMGVYEQDAHPWIRCEIDRLAKRVERGLPTLGVCLGAQMIAAAMGADVHPGPVKEVGFAPVSLHVDSPLRHVDEVPVLHWHGDTFTLPDNVELLASSTAYAHQAFRRGAEILALQFHAEMGEDPRFEAWLESGADYVTEAGNSPERLRADHDALGSGAVEAGRAMIREWLRGL
ncbi:glutamine amidotransferase [Sphingomonas soli]|uniref:glutamine amidotransferase n=1 Tax=Sphingomonas soli TaxID=266127 RepID=UPI0008339336|nr:glutamine amidotransferase [Sphingomonas soli]